MATPNPGLLPTLIERTTSPSLLQEIACELQPAGHTIPPEFLGDLFHRDPGNIRICLGELYDLDAQRDLT